MQKNTPLGEELYTQITFNHQLFECIHEQALDGLWYCNPYDPASIWASAKFWSQLGFSTDKHPELSSLLLFDSPLRFERALNEFVMQYETVKNLTVAIKTAHGGICWYTLTLNRIELKSTKDIRVIIALHNITRSHQKELMMEQCNEVAKIGYWNYDILTQKLFWSKVTKEIHEVETDYTPGISEAILFYKEGENRQRITKLVREATESGASYYEEFEIITAKGNSKFVKSLCVPELNDQVCVRIFGTFQDITEERETRKELLREKRKLINLISSTQLGVWEWNVQTGETNFNERWAEIIGYTLKELEPLSINTWLKYVHPDDLTISNRKLQDCFKVINNSYECEIRMKHKLGHWIWVLARGSVYEWTEDGKPLLMNGTHEEITAHKNKIEEYVSFIQQAPSAIAMFDREMRYIAHSELWLKEYKLVNKDIIGKSHYVVFPEIGDEWKQIHQNCLRGQEVSCNEDQFVRSDGSIQYLKWHVKPWYTVDGEIGGLTMLTEDITSQKKMAERLRVIEDTFSKNFEYSSIGMALVSANYKWVKINQRFCNMIGYSEDELRNLTFKEFTHPDDLEADLKNLRALVNDEIHSFQMEKRYIHKNGNIVYVILAVSQVKYQSGKTVYFIVQVVDITALKHAEQEIRKSLQKKQSLYDASPDVAIIEVGLDGLVTAFNKGAENLLGYQANEIINKERVVMFHLEEEITQRKKELEELNKIAISEQEVFTYGILPDKPVTREWTLVNKNGELIPVQVTITCVMEDGIHTGYIGIIANLKEVKKAEQDIQRLLNTTQNQNARLKNFAHIVSHNLRSHSGNMASLMDMVSEDVQELKLNPAFDMLKKASDNLNETIAHLREVAIMNDHTEEELEKISLSDTLNKAIESVTGLAKDAQVNIQNKVKEDVYVLGNKAYLDSILLNLLTNGIKYRSPERVSFVELQVETAEGFAALKFIDNGLGIDLKTHGAKLFGMYKTFHRHPEARGIGLFITKNQIEAMGGRIEVTSEVGVGSTFTVYFKLPNT